MVAVTTEPVHVALSIAVLVIAYGLSLPALSYCTYILKVHWNERYIAKRYPWILAGLIGTAAVLTLIDIPFNALARISESVPWAGDKYHYIELLGWECRVIFCSLMSLRVYLLA